MQYDQRVNRRESEMCMGSCLIKITYYSGEVTTGEAGETLFSGCLSVNIPAPGKLFGRFVNQDSRKITVLYEGTRKGQYLIFKYYRLSNILQIHPAHPVTMNITAGDGGDAAFLQVQMEAGGRIQHPSAE